VNEELFVVLFEVEFISQRDGFLET